MGLADPFRFSAKNAAGEWLLWNGGSPTFSATATYLEEPKKTAETETTWTRSIDTRGLVRGVTTPYDFIKQTASILRYHYYNGSVQSRIFYLIEWLNPDTLAYEDFFSGEIDLSTFSDGTIYNGGSIAVGATIIEGGIVSQLEGAGTTDYSIPILTSDSDLIFDDGLKLRGGYNYIIPALGSTTFNSANMFMPQTLFTTQEGDYPVATSNNQAAIFAGGYPFGSFSGSGPQLDAAYANYLFEAQEPMDLRVNVYFPNFYYSNTATGTTINLAIDVLVVPAGAPSPYNFSQRFNVFADASLTYPNNRNLPPINVSTPQFTVGAGDRVYFVHYFVTNNTPYGGDFNYAEGAVHIYADFQNPPSLVRGYQLWKVVDKLLTAITGLTGILQSSYLTAPNGRYQYMNPYNVRLTCGDALRGLTTDAAGTINITPSIRISWVDMMRYLKYAHGCGMDVRNGKVVIERASYFFDQDSIIADCGECDTMRVEPARDYMFNSFKAGYPVFTYDKLNGKDEANTTATWTGPFTHFSQEDQTVNIRTDPYGMEEVRANLSNKKTIDASSDNDTFAIETEATTSIITPSIFIPISVSAYRLYRPQNSFTQPAVTGFLFVATMYNLTMLPILNLLRNGSIIRSMFRNLETQILKFQSTDKNPAVFIDLGGGVIQSNADILISTLDAPLWKPDTFPVELVLPRAFLAAMRNAPSGCIRFSENGYTYKGFPLLTGVKSADRNTYNFILLCTADTDLLQRAV